MVKSIFFHPKELYTNYYVYNRNTSDNLIQYFQNYKWEYTKDMKKLKILIMYVCKKIRPGKIKVKVKLPLFVFTKKTGKGDYI